MLFAYEALSTDGRFLRDRLEADDQSAALDSLRQRGLMVVKLEHARDQAPPGGLAGRMWRNRPPGQRDLLLFARQMKMMLESGSALVPALDAIERQTSKPSFQRIIRTVRGQVEGGESLHEAMRHAPGTFSPIFCNMIAAGEATGMLAESFDRLAAMIHQQVHIRRSVSGALIYPALLSVLLLGVIGVLVGFVIPRFAKLFESLNHELPWITSLLIDASHVIRTYWPVLAPGLAAAATLLVLCARLPALRARAAAVLMAAPLLGGLLRRLQLARILRVWAAQLRSHVPLLETIARSRDVVALPPFAKLIDDVEASVSSGGHMGRALAQSSLIDPVLASAVTTGEENGRLAEAVEFISQWLDEENNQAIANLTRTVEPVMLVFMGLVVGFVAMALFIPLFDVATAAG
ncbi:MAG: type II secretion system F family protein [Phycisphaerae bacterium]|jgi:type IV pilus assembly protein PilC|nr:type II secretion system F family protein [Phycisphaerae bacterium]MCZ2398310.1 type II secretion system F family protein [Phycisphaerae bacterium]